MDIPHLGFIVAAYGATAIILGGTAIAVLLDGRAQTRLLARLERRPTEPEAGEAE